MATLGFLADDDCQQFVRLLGQVAFADDPVARFKVSQPALLNLLSQWSASKNQDQLFSIELALKRNIDLVEVLAKVMYSAAVAKKKNRTAEPATLSLPEGEKTLAEFLSEGLTEFRNSSSGKSLDITIGPANDLDYIGIVEVGYYKHPDPSQPEAVQFNFEVATPCWSIALALAQLMEHFTAEEIGAIRLMVLADAGDNDNNDD